MTVADLIAELSRLPPDAVVVVHPPDDQDLVAATGVRTEGLARMVRDAEGGNPTRPARLPRDGRLLPLPLVVKLGIPADAYEVVPTVRLTGQMESRHG
jgi:hypothetical protein